MNSQINSLATLTGCRLSLATKSIMPMNSRRRGVGAAFSLGVCVAAAVIAAVASIAVFN